MIILGMFVSRAMMSMGMIGLIANAIFHHQLPEHFRRFIRKPYLWLLSLYFILSALSGLWSHDKAQWMERMQIMLPFLILPFAFSGLGAWPKKWLSTLFSLFILLTITGISWSLYFYFSQKDNYDLGFGFSRGIPTPFKNDHIRFSLAVVLSICFSVDLFMTTTSKIWKGMLALFTTIGIIYLHILSAKTGLLTFYIIGLLFVGKLLLNPSNRKYGFIILSAIIILPVVMYFSSAALRNKIGYFLYSLQQMKNEKKESNISDEGRLISYGYALESIRKHPLQGVGLGDVLPTMESLYSRDFPNEKPKILLPHNQFLMSMMAIGIGGFLLLLLQQIFLFRLALRQDFLYFSFMVMMSFTMMIEPLYETQYGTCMFLFWLLLLLHRQTEKVIR